MLDIYWFSIREFTRANPLKTLSSYFKNSVVNFKKRGLETSIIIMEINNSFLVVLHLDGLCRYVNIYLISFYHVLVKDWLILTFLEFLSIFFQHVVFFCNAILHCKNILPPLSFITVGWSRMPSSFCPQ